MKKINVLFFTPVRFRKSQFTEKFQLAPEKVSVLQSVCFIGI